MVDILSPSYTGDCVFWFNENNSFFLVLN